jgi:hypothetical protein
MTTLGTSDTIDNKKKYGMLHLLHISVYWLHNISGVVKTIYGSETTKYSGSSPLVPSLTVSGVDFTDIGLYTCIAENSIGTGTLLVQENGVPRESGILTHNVSGYRHC